MRFGQRMVVHCVSIAVASEMGRDAAEIGSVAAVNRKHDDSEKRKRSSKKKNGVS